MLSIKGLLVVPPDDVEEDDVELLEVEPPPSLCVTVVLFFGFNRFPLVCTEEVPFVAFPVGTSDILK